MRLTDRRRRAGEAGQVTPEYLAVIGLVAILTVALVGFSGISMASTIASAFCSIGERLGGPSCGSDDGDSGPEDGDDGTSEPPVPPPDPDNPCGFVDPPTGNVPRPHDPELGERGEGDADVLAGLVGDHDGLGRPLGIAIDMGPPHFDIVPIETGHLAETYPDLVGFFDEHADSLDDPSYAAGLVNELGPAQVRSLMDMVNTFGQYRALEDAGVEDLQAPYRDFVEPLARMLGAADRSGQLDPVVRDAIVNSSPPTDREILDMMDPEVLEEHGVDPDDPDARVHPQMRWILEVQRARANAVLLDAGNFSSGTTADLAEGLLAALPPKLDALGLTEGFGTEEFFDDGDHGPSLSDNRWVALAALAADPNAATLLLDDPEGRELVEKWLSDETYDEHEVLELMIERRLGEDRDALVERMQDATQDALDAECD